MIKHLTHSIKSVLIKEKKVSFLKSALLNVRAKCHIVSIL